MALSNEDKKDVKGAFGKAMANKVAKVTNDRHIHAVGVGYGVVKKPENMQRNPVLTPKSKALKGKKDTRPLTGKGHDYYGSIEHDFNK